MDANFGESQKTAITGSVVIEDQANYYNRECCSFFLQEKYSL
jgi:hypothetical protein